MPWEGGEGAKPVGYGFDSVAAHIEAMISVEEEAAGLPGDAALARRRAKIEAIDRQGILATPANSFINELVVEAGRLSIRNDGAWVSIAYTPSPHVSLNTEH